jgi:lipoyl-dependent peroxiredoxin
MWKIRLTKVAIDAEVDLHLADGASSLSARLNVSLPDVDRGAARELVEDAHQICPNTRNQS